MTDSGDAWFECEDPTPFIERTRELATTALARLVPPEATFAFTGLGGSLLCVAVPGIPDGEAPVITNNVQVMWEKQELGGYWGCSHLWDDYDERDKEALVVRGVPLAEDEAAAAAVAWLAEQLSRPLDYQVWRKAEQVVAQRWVLTDTGREVGHRGRRRTRRQPPTEVVHLRGTTGR